MSGHGRAGSLQKLSWEPFVSALAAGGSRVLFFPMSSLAKIKRLDSLKLGPKIVSFGFIFLVFFFFLNRTGVFSLY